jgi:hypothetical protein
MHHSGGGIFHSFAARFNTRKGSFRALSSVGKWPLVLTARRSLAFKLSMAFVVYMIRRTSSGNAKNGITSGQFRRQDWEIAGYFCPHRPSAKSSRA